LERLRNADGTSRRRVPGYWGKCRQVFHSASQGGSI
jgi:hypothetical protein